VKVIRTLDQPVSGSGGMVVAVGNFDGVHLGHRKVLERCRLLASDNAAEAWALTFDPHPQRIVRPAQPPPLLMTLNDKLERIESLGMDGVLVVPFDQTIAAQKPAEFISSLIKTLPGLTHMVVGPNWRFGHHAAGTIDTLAELGEEQGFKVDVCDPCVYAGKPISSTRLRNAVQSGRLDEFREMSGHPYRLRGIVIRGKQVGRALGFPTANLEPATEALPPYGVFAVRVEFENQQTPGAGYFGRRTGVGSAELKNLFETYLFDFEGDLYGKLIEVDLLSFIRPDQRFESETALQSQIREDIEAIRSVLSALPEPSGNVLTRRRGTR
jgi:riboflavin kinase/FMN adenylyltransferase